MERTESDPIQTSGPYLGRCSVLARSVLDWLGEPAVARPRHAPLLAFCDAFFLKAPGENDVKNTATKLAVLL
jgi:hypothetical protein